MLDREHQLFGTFPPELQWIGDESEMNLKHRLHQTKHTMRRHWSFIVAALLLSFAGVVCLLVSELWLNEPWKNLLNELGSVLIGIGVIGVAVDVAFQSQLAKDVFQGAFGYLLHPELRGQLQWIYGFNMLATEYQHEFEVIPIDGDPEWVIIRETVTRTYNALGDKSVSQKFHAGVGEFFRPGHPTRVLYAQVTQEGKEKSLEKGGMHLTKGRVDIGQQRPVWQFSTDKNMEVEPNKPVTFSFSSETKHPRNGTVASYSQTPTLNARVILKLPEGFEGSVNFANPEQWNMRSLGGNRYELHALILPLQAVRFHWRLSADAVDWPKQ